MCVRACVYVYAAGCEEEESFEGMAPTLKRKKVVNSRALKLSLNSGRYPAFKGHEGVYQRMDPRSTTPLDYLMLLWPDSLVDVIVTETNRYALSKGRPHWKNVIKDEIWTFLGIILLMGIHRLPKIRNYWSKDSLLGVPGVGRSMSLARFWSIWCNVHLVDNAAPSSKDGLSAKLEPVLTVLERTFFMNYHPGQELCVDEAMIKYKGRVRKGRVSMPRKPIKKGFKVWCCCCSCCGYLCSFQVYGGKPVDPITGKKVREEGLAMRVVQDLMTPFRGMNHVVYLDNFFTSGPLVDALAKCGIYTAGTIQQKAKGFPELLKGLSVPANNYVAHSVNGTTYYVFNDRKKFSLVSNAFPEAMGGTVTRLQPKGRTLKSQHVPPVLPAYNKFMGAVDRLSQVRKTYGFDRRSRRYWLRPFMNFFDFAVNNAYLLYKHNCKAFETKDKKLLDFRMDLIHLLLKKPINRTMLDSDPTGVCRLVNVKDIGISRGRCHHCTKVRRANIKYTSFGCSHCKVRLCKINCFTDYHLD